MSIKSTKNKHEKLCFLEPSSTFIISPMMERTLFQLTQAITAYRIGVIHAPSQYGRSTVIQTLAQVFNIIEKSK
jgi:hypothetical protein